MDISTLFNQILSWMIDNLPADTGTTFFSIITFVIALATFILRFWMEPQQKSKWHWVWTIIHTMATLKVPPKNIQS